MKFPKQWVEAKPSAKKVTAKKQSMVRAKIDMSAEVAGKGLCPECHEPMQEVWANGIKCLCCLNCRIALPKPSEIQAN